MNTLTSLAGVPKFIGSNFWLRNNDDLVDVTDIWDSEIIGSVFIQINSNMASLPLVKFHINSRKTFSDIFEKNYGSSKQNILNLQYDLIENGYSQNARWR